MGAGDRDRGHGVHRPERIRDERAELQRDGQRQRRRVPANCADTGECGNFGAGCIKCAAKAACSVEYDACLNDAPCKAYSLCLDKCGPKDLDCAQLCANESPSGAAEYQALTRCVLCGDCAALCDHAPDTCK